MTRLLTSATLVCTAAMCAAVPAVAQPPAPCLRQIEMYSFDAVPGNKSLIVTTRDHARYRVNFQIPCHDLQFHLGLKFKTFGTSNLSCVARGDQVLARDPAGPGFCMIQSVQMQTPELDKLDADAKAAKAKP
jgi:hypothetical protein